MEKFAITGELFLATDIKSTLANIKEEFKKANIDLNINFKSSDILKKVKELKETASKERINLGVVLSNFSIKNVYREMKALKNGIESKTIVGKVNIDLDTLRDNVRLVYKEFRNLKNSLKTPITNKLTFDISSLQSSIKAVYSELVFLRNSFKNPLSLYINVVNADKVKNVIDTLNRAKSKKVVLDFSLRTDSLDKFDFFKKNIDSVSDAVSRFNIAGLKDISNNANSVVTALNRLTKLSGKKVTFDFSVKDINKLNILDKYVNAISASFDKASNSARQFNTILSSTSGLISALKNSLNALDFGNINQAANSVKSLSNSKVLANQQKLTNVVKQSGSAIYELGVQSGETLKRFGAYTIVTATFFRLSFAIRNALAEFVDFNKELTKVRQVTGQSIATTKLLGDEVGRLATLYGVSSNSILNTSLVLAQAGFSAKETKEALEALTKTEVAPTFDSIENTVEGAIAAMAQFGIKTKDLDKELSSINAVSAAFAVESEDLTTAVQKAGGAFSGASGNVDELRAIFTSARATTRESADTIATGLRTITTRLQRVRTSDFLRDLGINIRFTAEEAKKLGKTEGDFVGPYEALKRIAEATRDLSGTDPRFAQITEELGGFRQINKVIPILKNFTLAEEALRVSQQGTNTLTKDALIAQESYANQLERVRQEFLLLIRTLAEDESIKELITDLLELAKAGLRVAQTFKDIVPLLTVFGGIKGFQFLGTYLPGIKDAVLSRNSGGYIPGGGKNKDTVPALLTKGEYVLRRSAVQNIGVENLNRLNSGVVKFNQGGPVGSKSLLGTEGKLLLGAVGLGALSELGLVESFNNAEDSVKKFTNTILGTISQIALVKFLFKDADKKFQEKIGQINEKRGSSKIKFEPEEIQLRKNDKSDKLYAKIVKEEQNLLNNREISNKVESKITKSEYARSKQRIALDRSSAAGLSNRTDENLYNLFPKQVRDLFDKAGIKREVRDSIGNVDASVSEGNKNLEAAGRYRSKDKIVELVSREGFARKKSSKRASTFFHEYGHALDELLGNVRDDTDFVKAFKKDYQKLSKAQKKEFGYFLQEKSQNKRYARGEIFAQSFSEVISGSSDSNFSKAFPNSTKFVSGLVGNTPIETERASRRSRIAKLDQEIANYTNLRSVANPVPYNGSRLGQLEGNYQRAEDIESRRRMYQYAVDNKFRIAGGGGGPPRRPPGGFDFSSFFGGFFPPNNPPNRGPGGRSNGRIKSLLSKFKPGESLNSPSSAVIASIIGSSAGSLIQESSIATKDRSGNRTSFVAGGALSGAASGAAFGALAGSVLGPLGAGVGTAVGALTGGIYGAVTSLETFDNQLKTIKVDKISDSLNRVFSSISEGKTTFGNSRFDIQTNLKELQKTLQTTSNQGVREDTLSVINNNAVNIRTFYDEIARSSSSLGSFNQKVDIGTQKFVAGVLNIPFNEFQDEISKVIQKSNEQALFISRTNLAINEFNNRIKALSIFTAAFKEASSSVNTFTNNLRSFAFGSAGETRTENTISGQLTNLKDVVNTTGLKRDVTGFTNQFGAIGRTLGQSVNTSIDVKSIIPEILLQLKNSDALGPDGSLEIRFTNLVTEAFKKINGGSSLNPSQANTLNILSSQFQTLLGEDLKDSNFYKALDEDFDKVVNDFSNKLEQVPASIAESFDIANNRLNKFSEDLESLRVVSNKLKDGFSSQFDRIGTLIQSRADFNNTDPTRRLLLNERARTDFLTGGRNVDQLVNLINFNKQGIQTNSSRLQQTTDIALQIQLRTALERQRSAVDNATLSLEHLANSSNELTILQSRLSIEQEKRSVKKQFVQDLVFADPGERRRLQRVSDSATQVARTSSLGSISRSLIPDVRSFLETNFNNIIGDTGLKGKDVIDNLIKNDPNLTKEQKALVAPGKEEVSIQQQIENQIATQIAAQDALNAILEKDRIEFSKGIRTDMSNFLTELNNIILRTQTADIQSNISSKTSELTSAKNNLTGLSNINRRFGVNAINNAEEIKSNQQIFEKALPEKLNAEFASSKIESLRQKALSDNSNFFQLSGARTIKTEDFNKIIGNLIKDFNPEQISRISSDLSKANIGRDFENGTVEISKAFDVVKNSLETIASDSSLKLTEAKNRRDTLISNVGGKENFNNILKNADDIIKLSNQFPKDITISQLNNQIKNLNIEIGNLKSSLPGVSPIRRNSGGIVPGAGNTDSVPALLTPGEFVLNKKAVKNYGINTLRKINGGTAKYAEGGLVSQSGIISTEYVNQFNLAVNQLAIQVQNIKDAFASMPSQITMNGTHRVDVYINGAQAFNVMKQEFSDLITGEIKKSINRLIKTKFPNVGQFDG